MDLGLKIDCAERKKRFSFWCFLRAFSTQNLDMYILDVELTPLCTSHRHILFRRSKSTASESTYLAPFPRARFHGRLKSRGNMRRMVLD